MDEIKLLDHGYLRLIEAWGSDERIIEAARMSTGKGFLGWEPGPCSECGGSGHEANAMIKCRICGGTGELKGDKKLLAYLWNNKHATPFEMAGMIVEVQAPIMVFREWHRHRTQSYNEMSARYVPLPDVNYIPTIHRLMVGASNNRQAAVAEGAPTLTEERARSEIIQLEADYHRAEDSYQRALAMGVPKELARLRLPVGRYSRMRASANLRNWLGFLTLRMAPAAQYEIRVYANAVGELVAERFPRTWELFAAKP